jgi:hypothetical protein
MFATAIDLKVGGKVPAEVRHSDHNETAGRLTRSCAKRDSGDEDKNQNRSANVAG